MSNIIRDRMDELERDLEEQKHQRAIAEENFNKLYQRWSDISAHCKALEEENREKTEKINALQEKWEKLDEDYSKLVQVRDNLLSTTHRLADDLEAERATNKMMIDGFLDLVRKIMEA